MKINFDNSFIRKLPGCFSYVNITPLKNPRWIHINNDLANSLNIEEKHLQSETWLQAVNGEALIDGMQPISQVYAGHQFGGYTPQLGDGRACLLGEVHDRQGRRVDLQVKGSGPTPYSRMGDGRAVLRSTIREYLASEALYRLGIPTTRALAIASSDEVVYREQPEPGALLLRTAESHIRFGHFEYFFYSQQPQKLQALIDYTLERHYPECQQAENPVAEMLTQVVMRTADLIAKWQAFGFAHGVMNTDNMAISGETLDYGPFAFIDDYNPGFVCNHSDHSGRYAFDAQPGIALWNLNALAHALSDHASLDELKHALAHYQPRLIAMFGKLMRQKLGLGAEQEGDSQLAADWLSLLHQQKQDYTHSFRLLCDIEQEGDNALRDNFIDRPAFDAWLSKYQHRVSNESTTPVQRQQSMRQANPKYILRNYLAQQVIEQSSQHNHAMLHDLMTALQRPFDEQPQFAQFAQLPPQWGKELEISCSS